MALRATACARHCTNGCALLVETGKDGRVRRIQGDPKHPFTRGVICAKTARFHERLYSPDRIVTPLLRQGRDFVPVSWDEALGIAAERISRLRAAPERMLLLHYYQSFGVLALASRFLFNSLGASTFKGSPCLAAGVEAVTRDFGRTAQPAWSDLLSSERIVIWGYNLAAQAPHQGLIVRQARDRGARVLAITPGDADLSAFADAHIRIRPGCDRFLAAAVAKLLLDQGLPAGRLDRAFAPADFLDLLSRSSLPDLLDACGTTPDQAGLLAEWYASSGPTATLVGRGLQRHPFGGEAVRWIDSLAFLGGQLGRAGGGVYYRQGDPGHLSKSWVKAAPGPARHFAFASLGQEIEAADPPVELVWIEGMNPVTSAPDSKTLQRALRERFTIAVEPFPTDTALCASLILPPALMLETEDILTCDAHEFIHHAAPVVPPRGEARTNFRIAADLAARLDPPVPFPDPEQVLSQALAARTKHTDLAELRAKGYVRGIPPQVPWAGNIFAHEDGLYRLPGTLHPEPAPPLGYPLRLLSLIRRNALLSQIPEEEQSGPVVAYLSPDSPALAALDLDAPVFLETELGRLPVRVEPLPGLHPEAVLCHRGGWLKHSQGLNRLIAGREADLGGQAAYYGQWARLVNGRRGKAPPPPCTPLCQGN